MKMREFRDDVWKDYWKVKDVLKSCQTEEQVNTGRNMVNNFFIKWTRKTNTFLEINYLWTLYDNLIADVFDIWVKMEGSREIE